MTDLPRVHVRPVDGQLDAGTAAVLLCPFRLCDWHSGNALDMDPAAQDAAVRWHLLDDHRAELTTLAQLADAPDGLCARPHPAVPGRYCLDPRGHTGGSHGDGRVDRWVIR